MASKYQEGDKFMDRMGGIWLLTKSERLGHTTCFDVQLSHSNGSISNRIYNTHRITRLIKKGQLTPFE